MIETEGLACKYASALMHHYGWYERDISWILRLRAIAQFLREHRHHFVYAHRSLYSAIFEIFGFHESDIQSMLMLLEQQQRLVILPDVLYRVIDRYKQQHGIEYCRVSSALSLTDAQAEKIKQLLEQRSGKKLLCFYETDPSLIAGIRARSETFVWEDSVEQRLRVLEQI
jgi:ATP synthase F1 delta subunit